MPVVRMLDVTPMLEHGSSGPLVWQDSPLYSALYRYPVVPGIPWAWRANVGEGFAQVGVTVAVTTCVVEARVTVVSTVLKLEKLVSVAVVVSSVVVAAVMTSVSVVTVTVSVSVLAVVRTVTVLSVVVITTVAVVA